jgi:hypothetical protein
MIAALSLQIFTFVCQGVVALSQLNTYSSHAVVMVPFGLLFDLALTFRRWILMTYLITFFSSLSPLVVPRHVSLSCNSFDLLVFGSCGMKEISDCLEIQQIQ